MAAGELLTTDCTDGKIAVLYPCYPGNPSLNKFICVLPLCDLVRSARASLLANPRRLQRHGQNALAQGGDELVLLRSETGVSMLLLCRNG
jgi:hypothetical protein